MNLNEYKIAESFVQYLTGIAPEGETVLLVKQKPRIYDGRPALHKDGTPKYSWPAFLPERFRPGGSWYGNTGCFIISRFKDGQPSFSSACCERVAFLVLDDVGTKAKMPPLAPTWKIETSPGNFQWGYTFALDDQPTKGAFAAAIKAIAEAGYTDRGAVNPVRNFRLPGSINLKPEKHRFAARLTEFTPEREFTLPQICAALGVTPGEAEATVEAMRIEDTGHDVVLDWLNERSLVVAPANPEGWVGVVCPNAEEHSDRNPEGRYLPATRAYACFHEHCGDWNSHRFLVWVEEQGGPKVGHGLRDDLLAMTMNAALNKVTPTEAFPDEAAAVIAEVERREVSRTEKAGWYERFAYIMSDDSYFDMAERREVSRTTFNAIFRHVPCKSIHNGRRIEASICYDENRQAQSARVLEGVTYAAGESILVSRNGLVFGNRWRNARPVVEAKPGVSIAPWLRHMERLIPSPAEREHVLNVMAFKLQNPKIKVNHAILHAGTQGCGKDTLWAPFIWSVCGPDSTNRGLVDNDSVSSAWGYHLESEILILNELREPDAHARRALANKLKPIIAAPPEMLTIQRKGLHPYDMANRVLVLAFSNDRVPISLESQDRRWFCIYSHAPRLAEAEAAGLWQWYKSGGYEAIAAALYARDVSAFNPAATPMFTEFKANLVEHGMSMAESFIVELIRTRTGEFASGVIGSPFHGICDRLAGAAPQGTKVPQTALLHALEEAGWVDCGRLASAELTTKKHVWCAPEFKDMSKSDLRRRAEPQYGSALTLVKK